MGNQRYWKSTITATVLTAGDSPLEFGDLVDVHTEIVEGEASGVWKQTNEEVTKEQMAALLEEQGSDPEFLIQDEDDEDEDQKRVGG